MPELKVIYIAGFNLDKNSGRNKATREKTNALKGLLPQGCFTLYYPGRSASRIIAYLKVFFFDLLMLRRLLFVDRNTRILQRTTFLPLTNIYLKLRGVCLVYELHTDLRDEIKYYQVIFFEKLILHLYVFAERLNLKLASKIIYNHPVLQQTMYKVAKPSIYTYNGCNISVFHPLNMASCRTELNFSPGLNYYLFIGSLSKWRGIDLVVNIFNTRMLETDILYILGNASTRYGRQIKSLAASNPRIIFHEEVDSSLVVKYINAANICLVPVKPILSSPGNPLKLYDYIACGKPVIGQENVIGCSDEIEKYGLGITTDFYNSDRAAHDLRSFSSTHNPEHYTIHNREIALNQVSWEKRMQDWITFLKE